MYSNLLEGNRNQYSTEDGSRKLALWARNDKLCVAPKEQVHIHLNVEKPVFDPELVQRVRKEKASREKAYIKRQLSSAHIERPKTFQVSLTKSRFAPIKRIMEQVRGESSVQSVETGSRRLAITQQKDKKEVQAPALLKD